MQLQGVNTSQLEMKCSIITSTIYIRQTQLTRVAFTNGFREYFSLYAYNLGLVDGTCIYQLVVDIVRELPFPIYLSPSRSREGTS